MEMYSFQAVVMAKLDKNLAETHGRIVPDMIGEISFWRNYFYEIENFFKEKDQHSRLGDRIQGEEQARRQEVVD